MRALDSFGRLPRSSLGLIVAAVVATILTTSPRLSANDTIKTQPKQNPLQEWWNGNSGVPVIDLPRHEVPGKTQSASGSLNSGIHLRQELADAGLSFSGAYTAFFLGSVSGGESRGFAYNHMLFFQLNADLEKLVSWQGATLVWSWVDNAGSNLTNSIGNNFQVSTDYGPNSFIFNELYIMQTFLEEKLALKVGQMSALNDFASSPLYDVYANLAFCGNPVGLPFTVPLTAMPAASWGAHLKYTEPEWYAQAGVYQVSSRIGVPAYHGLDYSIRRGDGTIIMAEAGWTPSFFTKPKAVPGSKDLKSFAPMDDPFTGGYQGNYKIGVYYSNWSYAPYSRGPAVANLYGFYFLADQMVYQEPASPDQGLFLWSAFTLAPQELIAELPFFVSGGIQYVGLIPERDKDRSIFGVAYGRYSRDLASQQASLSQPQETYEMVLEWSYQIQVNPWLTVQPDVQYIINPGATGTLSNAWVLGAVVNVSF